jgi:glutathione peroxidase
MRGPTWFQDLKYRLLQKFAPLSFEQNTAGTFPFVPVYDIPLVNIQGKPFSLAAYKGKRIIIVNVASRCGYTPQYAGLQELYKKFSNRLVVLGFPCNQFGDQEPGNEHQIVRFCSKAYGVTFPVFRKVIVKGEGIHPLYRWLTDPAMNGWNKRSPDWNFCKYVIDEQGRLMFYLSSATDPFDVRITGGNVTHP